MTYDTPVQQTTATSVTTTASSDTVAAVVKADESEGRLSGNKEWIAARNEDGSNVQPVEQVTRLVLLVPGGGSCATAPIPANNTTTAADDIDTAAVDVAAVTVGTVCAVPCAQLLLQAPAESQNSVLQSVLRHCTQQQQYSTALTAVDSFSYSIGSPLVLLNISSSSSSGTVSAPQWSTVHFSNGSITSVTTVEVAELAPLLTDSSNAVKLAVHAVMTHALQRSTSSSSTNTAAAAAAAVKALATAKKYAQNVAASAADPRFVRIRLANAVYNRSIGGVRGGAELMLALGFALQYDSGELCYVHDGAAAAVLHARVVSLSDAAAVADSAVQALALVAA
jgi:PUB domain